MNGKAENNYRITFYDGPLGNNRKSIDIYAINSDDAFDKAYKMPEEETNEIIC